VGKGKEETGKAEEEGSGKKEEEETEPGEGRA